jgi:hypothetical protein
MKKLALLGLLALAACAIQPTDDGTEDGVSEDPLATTYVDILDFWQTPTAQGQWLDVRRKLDAEFDAVCGDTFCGGDYANLTSLGFTCGVSSKAGSIRDCVWTFTGSAELVDPTTSALQTSIPSWQCHVKPKGTAKQLSAFLAAQGSEPAIRRVLPGTTTSLYDVIGECFQHPIGASPLVPQYPPKVTYVEALDYASNTGGQGTWIDARQNLKNDFDQVCGDTFCGGDYSNLQALRFVCSITRSTGNVKQCQWLFGGSYTTVSPKTGAVTVNAKSWRCSVPVKGTQKQLAAVLTQTSSTPAIRQALPGGTASAYDALLQCL